MKKVPSSKKIISLALAFATVVPFAMTGCKATPATITPDAATSYSSQKPMTLTVFSRTANYTGKQGGWFGKLLSDKFKVTLNIISGQGDGANLYATRSAAGNLGDIVILDQNQFPDAVKAGLVANITSLIKTQGSYISKNFPKALTRMKNTYGKGKILYGIPDGCATDKPTVSSDGPDLWFSNFMLYSAYKKIGMPKINTQEDLLPIVAKMQKARPLSDVGKKTYGFSLFKDWDGSLMTSAKQYACIETGYDEWGFNLVSPKGDKIESLFDKKGQYYRNLKFYHQASKLGLVDPDSYAQTESDWATKLKNGQTLTTWWNLCEGQYNTVQHTASTWKNASTKVSGPDGYVMVPIKDEKVRTDGFAPAGTTGSMGIGSKNPDKSRTMALINWLYSPEGMEASFNGPKGVTWTTDKNGKNPKLTTLGKKAVSDPTTKMPASAGGGTYQDGQDKLADFHCVNYNCKDPTTGEAYIYSSWKSYQSNPSALVKAWSKNIAGGALNVHEYLQKHNQLGVVIGSQITPPVLATAQLTEQNNIQAIVRKYSWQMAMTTSDSEFNSDWNTMTSQAKQAGLADVDKYFTAQYKLLKADRAKSLK